MHDQRFMKITVPWDVTPCSLVDEYQPSGVTSLWNDVVFRRSNHVVRTTSQNGRYSFSR